MPIAPEFSDAPQGPNSAPYLDPITINGTLLGSSVPFNTEIQIGVLDPNINDTLSGLWVANYPPYVSASSMIILGPQEGSRANSKHEATFSISVVCANFPRATDTNLTFIASDNGFSTPDTSKMYPYNYDKADNPIFVQASWKVTGCQ